MLILNSENSVKKFGGFSLYFLEVFFMNDKSLNEVLDKVISLHANLTEFRNDMKDQLVSINKRLDTIIEKNQLK